MVEIAGGQSLLPVLRLRLAAPRVLVVGLGEEGKLTGSSLAYTVRQAVQAAPTVLRDFLNDMAGLDTWREGPAVAEDKRSPAAWGRPASCAAASGRARPT